MALTSVVVIGGGYAGVTAANRLRKNPEVAVTLVNRRPEFVERIRLHQHATGLRSAAVPYSGLLGSGIRLMVDRAERIDSAGRRVVLESGRALPYDYLIYAVGSTVLPPNSVTNAAESAYTVADFESAQRLREVLRVMPTGGWVTVVGGGLTGIETAAELGEQGYRVRLATGGELGPSLSSSARAATKRTLVGLGVDVVEAQHVSSMGEGAVQLGDGTELPSAATVWTPGFGVPDLARKSGLATDELGRLLTDETLTCLDDDRIIGAGDAVAPSNNPLRMSCQAAMPLGARSADTVLSRIAGAPPRPIDQAFVAQCVSLGRHRGTIQFTRRDDTAMPAYLGGRIAAIVKESVCRGTLWMIRREAAKPGAYRWIGVGKRHRRSGHGFEAPFFSR